MARLEDITALLCMELEDFEKAIGRLEKLNREMKGHPLKMDTSEIERVLVEHRAGHSKNMREQLEAMERILEKVEKAIVFPSWAVKLGGALMIVALLVLGYALWEVSRAV